MEKKLKKEIWSPIISKPNLTKKNLIINKVNYQYAELLMLSISTQLCVGGLKNPSPGSWVF